MTSKEIQEGNKIKIRRLTDTQLRFIWKTIKSLQGYVNNMIEYGAKGVIKDYKNASKARDLIQQQRRYNQNKQP